MFLHLDRVGPPQAPCAHLNDGCSSGKGSDAEIVFALSILQSWVREEVATHKALFSVALNKLFGDYYFAT